MRTLDLHVLVWPMARREEALLALAQTAWGVTAEAELIAHAEQRSVSGQPSDSERGRRADLLAARLGLTITACVLHHGDVVSLPERVPLCLDLSDGVLVVAAGKARRVLLLLPEGGRRWVPTDALVRALRTPLEASEAGSLLELLAGMDLPASRRASVRDALLGASLGWRECARGVQLVLPAGAALLRQAQAAALPRQLGAVLGMHALGALLGLGAWALVGWSALAGHLDAGVLAGFALLLSTLVPVQVAAFWLQGTWLLRASALAKRRLLAGVLSLDVDGLRQAGAGSVLAGVLETAAFEGLALEGGLRGLLAAMELVMAAVVLAHGDVGPALNATLLAWCALLGVLGLGLWRARRRWTDARLELTDATVEHLLGLRTRLVQQPAHEWHVEEDAALSTYLEHSRRHDARATRFAALAARGFLVVGLAVLGSSLATGAALSSGRLAATLGGLLLAQRALAGLATSALDLMSAALSYRRVLPLLRAGRARADRAPTPALALEAWRTRHRSEALLEVRDMAFAHGERAVLGAVSLVLRRGERVLVEGPSGGGKSTLAALLAGLRTPRSGRLRLHGYERSAWGDEAWHASVALAAQFHENHVFSGSLAFNLLLGRTWPPTRRDLDEALEVCRELGLGELLERMPAGLHQGVGEAGWQLSHGERSRVFLARALLQRADVVILDESLAAFDARTQELCLSSAVKRAPSLVVIAHP